MYTLNVLATDTELAALKAHSVPPRLAEALYLQAAKVKPEQAVYVHVSAGDMQLYWGGDRVGAANKYYRDGREYWQVNLAPGYTKSIRRNTFEKLIDAVGEYMRSKS